MRTLLRYDPDVTYLHRLVAYFRSLPNDAATTTRRCVITFHRIPLAEKASEKHIQNINLPHYATMHTPVQFFGCKTYGTP